MKLRDASERRLHGDAFALNSFQAIRPHQLRDGVPILQGWPSAHYAAQRGMANLKGAAPTKVVGKLLTQRLIEEIPPCGG